MSYIVFNINTGLGLNAKDFITPFDRDSVKTGDIEKLKVYKDATPSEQKKMLDAKINQAAAIYYKDAEKDLPLYAVSGQILCISYFDSRTEDQWTSYQKEGVSEEDLIKEFWQICANCNMHSMNLVGFRSNYFDIPYIIQRSFILNIPMYNLYNGKWMKEWVVDCYDLWMREGKYNSGWASPVSNDMKTLAKAIGKDIDKSISQKFGYYFVNHRELAIAYADEEVEITNEFYKRLTNFFETPLKVGDILNEEDSRESARRV